MPRAVITHAHADHARGGSDAYWAAARGHALLRERLGKQLTPRTVDFIDELPRLLPETVFGLVYLE